MAKSADAKSLLQNPFVFSPLILIATLLALAVGIYFSPYKDDVQEYVAKRFLKAKAKAEQAALEHTGEEKARGFL
ncbi:uncharacterized protein KY384_005447 [Bacidia gigantensis]|uniref:uncharacterized protein n=1 Tax=Bacidia gigantensis TaxID=2732470 RepID=UPI001D053D17|nr:uncharacterized protein KY384_005447 [Bacidia gigantensis]KAG8529965.1 hypothetical protein KY384_005447 [Bacidia gigantensis]